MSKTKSEMRGKEYIMGNKLYLECGSGISGDMFVAAMLDLGADEETLQKALKSLPVDGFTTKISRVKKSGLDACDFDVILDDAHENHDHDMEYLHGHHEHTQEHGHDHIHSCQSIDQDVCACEPAHAHDGEIHSHEHAHTHTHEYSHDHEHTHTHEHTHDHDHNHAHDHSHTHDHVHRGTGDLLHLIDHADMTDSAKEIARKIVDILAQAEAKAHGVPLDQVHFHEVGAVDSIVDIIAAAVCADSLGLEEVYVPRLNEGTGMIRCQHGLLPIPVPAVSNIIAANHIPLHITNVEGELVTPTGAAIAAALRTKGELPEKFIIEKIGMGAGKREYACVGVLRAMLIQEEK